MKKESKSKTRKKSTAKSSTCGSGKKPKKRKSTKTLSRAVEKVEDELMALLISYLKGYEWDTTSLIHDEIKIQESIRFTNPNDELQTLTTTATLGLRNFEDSRGWPPGSLRVEMQKHCRKRIFKI